MRIVLIGRGKMGTLIRETASAAADAAKNLCREVFLTETV